MNHGGNVWQGDPAAWLDYSANIRPGGAPPWVRQALECAMADVAYYPDPAMRRARCAMAQYLRLPAACVLPTSGGISAIDLASRLSKRIWTFAPCFSEYRRQAENHGATVRSLPLLKDGVVQKPSNCLRDAIRPGDLVWLCNPMNPVGAAFDRNELARLLDLVERAGAYMAVDEAFIEYCAEHSVRERVQTHDCLLVTGSMTKILGVPGVRLGYLCAGKAVLSRLSAFQTTWELNCFAVRLACALPEHGREISEYAKENALNREALRRALEAMGVFVYPSQASFLLARFEKPAASIQAGLRARGILTRSCMSFEGLEDGRHLRLAVKDAASNARLIAALKEELQCAERA